MAKIGFPDVVRITPKQMSFIEAMTIDLKMTRASRNNHILGIINRPITYLDDMTVGEASKVITRFKEFKENAKDKLS